ncbi:MAG: hypothetical protein IKR21_03180 [Oscillospiraceae bacterium]|nr:hypothetical protein [Oscillospiraceae bacterium]
MRREFIYQAAADMFGETAGDMKAFCDAAADILEGRLKEGVSPEDCRGAFTTAAALYALAMKTDAEGASGGGSSYTAGSVTVRGGGSASASAGRLRQQAQAVLAPFCDDGSFAFIGVRG